MTKTIVVDTSALVPLFFQEGGTASAEALFSSAEYHCIAPDFLRIEFSNVLTTGIRRKRITPSEASRHLKDFREMALEVRPFPTPRDLQHVLDVATRTKLSFYDALYLVLTLQEGALLATWDKKLRAQAKKEGVEVLSL